MSGCLAFEASELEYETAWGKYWLSRYNDGSWSARFKPAGSDRYAAIDPPADEDNNASDWESLDLAKEACELHHAHLVQLSALGGEQVEANRPAVMR